MWNWKGNRNEKSSGSTIFSSSGLLIGGIYLLLLLLPLLGGGNYLFAFSPLWGQLVFILAATFLLLVQVLVSRERGTMITLTIPDYLFLFLITIITFSFFSSQNRPESLSALLLFFGSLSVAILVRFSFRTQFAVENAVKIILLSSVPVIIYEFYQSVWQMREMVDEVIRNENLSNIREHFQIHRTPFSTFMSSNNLASYLVMLVPLNLFVMVNDTSKNRVKWSGLFAFISAGIFLSESKGATIVYFVLIGIQLWLIYLFYRQGGATVFKRTLSAGILAVILALMLWNLEWKPDKGDRLEMTISTFKMTAEKLQNSAEGRMEYWQTAFNMWKDHWIGGAGIGTFATISPEYQESAFYSRHAHNDYLELLAETGLAGFAGFTGFMMITIAYGLKTIRALNRAGEKVLVNDDPTRIAFLIGTLILSMTGFLLHALIDFDWEIMANRTLVLLLSMMVLVLTEIALESGLLGEKMKISEIRSGHPAILGGALTLLIIQGFWLPKITIAESYFSLAQDPFETNLSRKIDYVENAQENFPHQSKYALFLASVYQKRADLTGSARDNQLALKHGETLLKEAPFLAQSHARHADLLFVQGKNEEAEREWLTAIEKEKMNLSYYNQLGSLYIQSQKYDKAKEILQKGLSLEGRYKRANHPGLFEVARGNLILGGLYEKVDQPEEALKKYRDVVRFYEENRSLRSSGMWEILETGLPSNIISDAHQRLGHIYISMGNALEADREFQLAKETAPVENTYGNH